MLKPSFKMSNLKVADLKKLCKWKKQKGDKALPTKRADLLKRWKDTKKNRSPHVRPCNSLDSALNEIESLPDSDTSVYDIESSFFMRHPKAVGCHPQSHRSHFVKRADLLFR